MLIPFSMIALGTQLVMTVADGVPKYDIARGCRLDSTGIGPEYRSERNDQKMHCG
jgi:hypothetical protein